VLYSVLTHNELIRRK